jgi:integrase
MSDTSIDTAYKLAKLVKAKRPFIVFSAYDEATKKLKEKRLWLSEKQFQNANYIESLIKDINERLKKGHHFRATQEKTPRQNKLSPIAELRKIVETYKYTHRKDTYRNYRSNLNIIENHVSDSDLNSRAFALSLRDSLVSSSVSARHANNVIATLITFINLLVERQVYSENNVKGLRRLPEPETLNKPFTTLEKEAIIKYLKVHDIRLYYFTQFLHQSFIRRTELTKIRVQDINLKAKTITIPGTVSKNKKTETLRLSNKLYDVVVEMKLEKMPKNWFVFGAKMQSCDTKIWPVRVSEAHAVVMKELGIKGKTLYTWKDTGICDAYISGVDIITLQRLVRHSSVLELQRYLRSVGLLIDETKTPEW